MKAGRKTGSIVAGSKTELLVSMEIGDVQYTETTLDDYQIIMNAMNPHKSKRPAIIMDRVFKTKLYTAIASAGDIRYVVRTERIS